MRRSRLKPRKDELKILSELNDQEFADEKEFLVTMFETVCAMLDERDSYLVAVKLGGKPVTYGPYRGLTPAKSALKKWVGAISAPGQMAEGFLKKLKAPASLITEETSV